MPTLKIPIECNATMLFVAFLTAVLFPLPKALPSLKPGTNEYCLGTLLTKCLPFPPLNVVSLTTLHPLYLVTSVVFRLLIANERVAEENCDHSSVCLSVCTQAPHPPQPWSDVLNATQDGPLCMQKNYLEPNPTVQGQEDCLYLNVYTPDVSNRFSYWAESLPHFAQP
jgi:hypothetical protein